MILSKELDPKLTFYIEMFLIMIAVESTISINPPFKSLSEQSINLKSRIKIPAEDLTIMNDEIAELIIELFFIFKVGTY